MQEEFELKTSGVCVDWTYRNIVIQQRNGESILLSPISNIIARKKEA